MAKTQYSALGPSFDLPIAISRALADRRWRFRTPKGIAKELDVDQAAVEEILRHRSDIARPSILRSPNGEAVWTLAGKRKTLSERVAHLRRILAREDEPPLPHGVS